jgi:hypothetical protein
MEKNNFDEAAKLSKVVLSHWRMREQKCNCPQLLVRIDDAASSFKVQFIDVCAELMIYLNAPLGSISC